MTTPLRYFALLTHLGAQKLAQAAATGKPLSITGMAVGDGNGQLPAPDPAQTALVNERRRGAVNTLTTDPRHPDQLIAEQVLPETEGGFWIREIGLYDKDGSLIAVGNCPETYKPRLQEGAGRTQTLRMVLIVRHTEAVNLVIDPSTVLATREYTDEQLTTLDKKLQQQLKRYLKHTDKSDAVTADSSATVATSKAVKKVHDIAKQKYTAQDATTQNKGLVRLSNAVDSDDETTAATPKALKQVYELAQKQYVPEDATPTQKGVVQLSSATDSTSETEAATPKAVRAAMREAKSKQPKGNYALKGDCHSKSEALNLFLQKSRHGADIPDKNAFIKNLGLSETVKQAQNAVPATRTINGHSLKQNLTLTAGDMKAFALGVTNIADSINNVSWNSPSGTYIVKVPGASQLLVHFNAGTGSAPALQLRADYANRGLWYRSARDNKGFEKGWVEIYTSQRKPSPAELGMYSNAEIDKRINTRSGKNTAGKAVNGWWKCGDTGLIIQWGTTPPLPAGTIYTVSLPVAVPNQILTAMAAVKQKGIASEGFLGVYAEISGKSLILSADYTRCFWEVPRMWFVICH